MKNKSIISLLILLGSLFSCSKNSEQYDYSLYMPFYNETYYENKTLFELEFREIKKEYKDVLFTFEVKDFFDYENRNFSFDIGDNIYLKHTTENDGYVNEAKKIFDECNSIFILGHLDYDKNLKNYVLDTRFQGAGGNNYLLSNSNDLIFNNAYYESLEIHKPSQIKEDTKLSKESFKKEVENKIKYKWQSNKTNEYEASSFAFAKFDLEFVPNLYKASFNCFNNEYEHSRELGKAVEAGLIFEEIKIIYDNTDLNSGEIDSNDYQNFHFSFNEYYEIGISSYHLNKIRKILNSYDEFYILNSIVNDSMLGFALLPIKDEKIIIDQELKDYNLIYDFNNKVNNDMSVAEFEDFYLSEIANLK